MKLYLIAIGCSAVVGWSTASPRADASPQVRAPSAEATPSRGSPRPEAPHEDHAQPHMQCAGGAESPLGVELHAAGVRHAGARRFVDLDLEIRNRFESNANVRYAVEFIDDRGHAYMAPETSEVLALARVGTSGALPVQVGRDVPDGFYTVRVTVVGAGAGNQGVSEILHKYYRFAGATTTELTFDEWRRYSRAYAPAATIPPAEMAGGTR
jgi:hypothetical protein